MSSNEDYLDSLLKSVMENKNNNEETIKTDGDELLDSSIFAAVEADPIISEESDDNLFAIEEPEINEEPEPISLLDVMPELSEEAIEIGMPEFELPEMELSEGAEEEEAIEIGMPEFELPEMGLSEGAEEEEAIEIGMPEFELPEMGLSEGAEEEEAIEIGMPEFELPEIEFSSVDGEEGAELENHVSEPVLSELNQFSDFAIQEPDMDELDAMEMPEPDMDELDAVEMPESDMNIPEVAAETEAEPGDLDFMALTEPDYDDISEAESGRTMSDDEIDAIFQAVDNVALEEPVMEEDDDLAEINGLLKQSESGSESDDDMLALLESMAGEKSNTKIWHDDENEDKNRNLDFDIEENKDTEDILESEQEKTGFFARLFGKKNKKKVQVEEDITILSEAKDQNAEDSDQGESIENEFPEFAVYHDSDDEFNSDEMEQDDLASIREVEETKGKKNNFFSKIFAFLTETDEEDEDSAYGMEPSEENKNILDELDQEDKKKKSKKAKGKGSEDDDELEGSKSKGKKEKKEKKPRKEKAPKAKKEEPIVASKRISPKKIALVAALCITLGIVIIMLTTVVPTYYDKKVARNAYTEADYSSSYLLLYGKKLDSSDELIYQKSKVIMEIKRKLDSYHNYISMGKELEALDALMSGVKRYHDIYEDAQTYNVTNEVDAIYSTILTLLKDQYRLEASMAEEINGYEDDLAYTRRLKSIVFGTPFVDPAEENAEKLNKMALESEQNTVVPNEQVEDMQQQADTADENQINNQDGVNAAEQDQNQEGATEAAQPGQEGVIAEVPQQVQDTAGDNTEGANVENGNDGNTDANQMNTGSQGQLIQGVKQPVEIKINGN